MYWLFISTQLQRLMTGGFIKDSQSTIEYPSCEEQHLKNVSHYSLKIFMSKGFLQLQFEIQIWFLNDFATLALSTRLMIKKNDSFTNWALLVLSLTCQGKLEQMSTFSGIESYRPLLWCFVSFLNPGCMKVHEKKKKKISQFVHFSCVSWKAKSHGFWITRMRVSKRWDKFKFWVKYYYKWPKMEWNHPLDALQTSLTIFSAIRSL